MMIYIIRLFITAEEINELNIKNSKYIFKITEENNKFMENVCIRNVHKMGKKDIIGAVHTGIPEVVEKVKELCNFR